MYALNVGKDGRILSATFERFASQRSVIVEKLPEGNIADYKYIDGKYIHEPLPEEEPPADE